jgi:hypothetical protein
MKEKALVWNQMIWRAIYSDICNNPHFPLPGRNVSLGNPRTTKIPTGKSHIGTLRSTFRRYRQYICKYQKSRDRNNCCGVRDFPCTCIYIVTVGILFDKDLSLSQF